MGETFRDRETRCRWPAVARSRSGIQQLSVYVFGPRWAGRGATLLTRMPSRRSRTLTLLAKGSRIGKDRQLLRRSDPLPQQLHLTLHSVKTTPGGGQLGAQLLGLAPQRPDPRAEIDARHQEQAHPDHHPPPHEAGPYPLGRVEPADLALEVQQ